MSRLRVIAVAVLVCGVTGCGSGGTTTIIKRTPPTTSTQVVTQTVTQKAPTKTVTQAATTTTPSATSTTATQPTSSGGQHFSGSGIKNIGTITVSAPSILSWTDNGGGIAHSFAVEGIAADYSNSITLSSRQTSGTTHVASGTYQNVNVIGDDSWTITISPG